MLCSVLYLIWFYAPVVDFVACRLHGKSSPIEKIVLQGQTSAEVSAQVDLQTKTVSELLALHIYKNQVNTFYLSMCPGFCIGWLLRFCLTLSMTCIVPPVGRAFPLLGYLNWVGFRPELLVYVMCKVPQICPAI